MTEDAVQKPPTPFPPASPSRPSATCDAWRPGSSGSRLTTGTPGHDRLSKSATTRLSSSLCTGMARSQGRLTSLSRRSASEGKLKESQSGKILKALDRAENAVLAETEAKWGKEARSAMTDFFAVQEEAKQRKRAKELAMPVHLRCGPNPIDMGCMRSYSTATKEATELPVAMAVDPKWSTELKRINNKVGAQIEYEAKISGVVSGLSPELPFMQPKRHLSNPPSPYFKPGQMPRQRVPALQEKPAAIPELQ